VGLAMYVTYFDEVKADPKQGQDSYWVGGICVPMSAISDIEVQVNNLARKWFNSEEMTESTEFHAKCIYFGKFPCKGWKPDRRLEVLTALVDVIANNENIRRVYARINTTKLKAKDKDAEIAFAMFCERVQLLVGKKSTTLLIGDLDGEKSSATIKEFSKYRIGGTPWEYGTHIPSIVDCVHFAHSHHSRMVQLADVYLFAETHKYSGRKGEMADKFSALIKERDLHPHRYKWWPT
jgi:Protein of unknown function (DUF3800)